MNAVAVRGSITATHQGANGTWLIVLRGEHDLATRPTLEQETRDLWPLCTVAVIDLSDVAFIDSGVITWLLKTKREREEAGACSVRIVEGQPGSVAARGLAVFRVREMLDCYATLEDALASASDSRRSSGGLQRKPPTGRPEDAALDARWRPDTDTGEFAGELFDRVGAQAWELALWIVKDEQLAEEVVIASFARAGLTQAPARSVDEDVLFDVRRGAMVAASARPTALTGSRHLDGCPPRSRAEAHAIAVRDAITALPEPQRAVIELTLFGRLTVGAIATATATPRTDVLTVLAEAVHRLRPIGRAHGHRRAHAGARDTS